MQILQVKWLGNCNPLYFLQFAQQMANRLIVGHLRYGEPKAAQKYMTRLGLEYQAYKRSGNREQLINIANYALLESIEPEHSAHHVDASVESVTRKKLGGEKK